jgi:hypothetical protein
MLPAILTNVRTSTRLRTAQTRQSKNKEKTAAAAMSLSGFLSDGFTIF